MEVAWQSKSKFKAILCIVFFDINCAIVKNCFSGGVTINRHYYKKTLKYLQERVKKRGHSCWKMVFSLIKTHLCLKTSFCYHLPYSIYTINILQPLTGFSFFFNLLKLLLQTMQVVMLPSEHKAICQRQSSTEMPAYSFVLNADRAFKDKKITFCFKCTPIQYPIQKDFLAITYSFYSVQKPQG